jgi:hypothetical protein
VRVGMGVEGTGTGEGAGAGLEGTLNTGRGDETGGELMLVVNEGSAPRGFDVSGVANEGVAVAPKPNVEEGNADVDGAAVEKLNKDGAGVAVVEGVEKSEAPKLGVAVGAAKGFAGAVVDGKENPPNVDVVVAAGVENKEG